MRLLSTCVIIAYRVRRGVRWFTLQPRRVSIANFGCEFEIEILIEQPEVKLISISTLYELKCF
jgi:hypothetical protein